MSSNDKKSLNWGEVAGLLTMVGLVWYLWSTPFIFPLKILVVFFHELSHGLAALATGGSILDIQVVEQQGGHCRTRGGNVFLILTAGYLGSLVWGGVILVLAARSRHARGISALVGGILMVATVLWVRPLGSFGFLFGLFAGLALAAFGLYLGGRANRFLLKLIGLTSCLYVIFDIKSDIIENPSLPSDAYMLSDRIGMPTLFWGISWGILAVVGSYYFVSTACRGRPPAREKPSEVP